MIKEKIYFAILLISVVGIIVAKLVTTLNYTVRTKEKLERIIPIPVLGELPLDESCYNKIIKNEVKKIKVEENTHV